MSKQPGRCFSPFTSQVKSNSASNYRAYFFSNCLLADLKTLLLVFPVSVGAGTSFLFRLIVPGDLVWGWGWASASGDWPDEEDVVVALALSLVSADWMIALPFSPDASVLAGAFDLPFLGSFCGGLDDGTPVFLPLALTILLLGSLSSSSPGPSSSSASSSGLSPSEASEFDDEKGP